MASGYAFKRFLFWTHLVTGLTVGAVLLVMAVTGTLMAFEPQILEWTEKDVRHVPVPAVAARLSVNEIAAKAFLAHPQAPVSGITLDADPKISVLVNFGRDEALFMNPYNGQVLGKMSGARQAFNFIESIHRYLALKDRGHHVTHAANFFFLGLALSGLYLWWPRKTMAFKSGLKGKAKDWNWHNVIGFWCLPMILVTTLTGLVMSYTWASNLLFRMTGNEPPPPFQRMAGAGAGQKPLTVEHAEINWDMFFKNAENQAPRWNTISVRTPKELGGTFAAIVQDSKNFSWKRSQMTLDAAGNVVKWEPFSEMNTGRKARIWARYLHTGESFGFVTQIIAFVSACGAGMLVWTGFAMAWRRFFTSKIAQV